VTTRSPWPKGRFANPAIDLGVAVSIGIGVGYIDAHASVLSAQLPDRKTWALVCDVLYCAMLFCIFVGECFECIRELRRSCRLGLLKYASCIWNWLDWILLLIATWQVSRYLDLQVLMRESYEMLYGDAEQEISNDNILLFQSKMVQNAVTSFAVRKKGATVLFMLVVRLFSQLRRHPRLSFVTSTLVTSMTSLGPFMFVFATMFWSFAIAGRLLFGGDLDQFSGDRAVYTMFTMLLGEFADVYESAYAIDPNTTIMYFWAFYIFMYYLMLNMLLAIILDSYHDCKEEALHQSSFTRDVHAHTLLFRRKLGCRGSESNSGYLTMSTEVEEHKLESWKEEDMQRLGIGAIEARILFSNCVAAREFEKLEDLDDVATKEDVQDTRDQIVSELGAMIKALEARLKRMER